MIGVDMAMIEGCSIPVPEAGCWIWAGTLNNYGYGSIPLGRRGANVGAHRIAWSLKNGQIPRGMFICHKCDTPACVNPDHLFLGTHAENMEDMRNKRRFRKAEGELNTRCKLRGDQVMEIFESSLKPKDLADIYGVSKATVYAIKNGDRWSHLTRKQEGNGP